MSHEYLKLLYDATRTPYGIVVQTEDPERLRQKLYALRKNNPDLASISFVISPLNPQDLWVLNKGGLREEEQ